MLPVMHWGNYPVNLGNPSYAARLNSTIMVTAANGNTDYAYTATSGGSGGGTVVDWEGFIRRCLPGEGRITGSRRVENLIKGNSEKLDIGSPWLTYQQAGGSVPALTAQSTDNPVIGGVPQTSYVTRCQFNRGATDPVNGVSQIYQSGVAAPPAGTAYVRCACWMKSLSGTPTVRFDFGGGVVNVAVSGAWVRYATPVVQVGTAGAQFNLGCFGSNWGGANTVGADILVTGIQVENVSGQSNQNPGEYITIGFLGRPWYGVNVPGVAYYPTKNGNTVASNIVTLGTGTAISTKAGGHASSCDAEGPLGFIAEPFQKKATVSVLSTETAFNSWSYKVNCTVAEVQGVGPGGEIAAAAIIETAVNDYHYIAHAQTTLLRRDAPDVLPGDATIQPPPQVPDPYVEYIDPRAVDTPSPKPGDPDAPVIDPGDVLTPRDVIESFAVLTDNTVIQSCFCAPGTRTVVSLRINDNGPNNCDAFFDLAAVTAGAQTVSGGGITAQGKGITRYANGYFRCWQIVYFSVLPTQVSTAIIPGQGPWLGVAGQAALWVWGHLVQGNVVSYYDAPSYAQVDRGYDDLFHLPWGNMSQATGTLYVEAKTKWVGNTGFHRPLFSFVGNNVVPGLFFYSTIADTGIAFGDGANLASVSGVPSAFTAVRKFACSWGAGQLRVAMGGVSGVSAFSGSITLASYLGIAQANSQLNGQCYIRNIKLWGTQATVGELRSMVA